MLSSQHELPAGWEQARAHDEAALGIQRFPVSATRSECPLRSKWSSVGHSSLQGLSHLCDEQLMTYWPQPDRGLGADNCAGACALAECQLADYHGDQLSGLPDPSPAELSAIRSTVLPAIARQFIEVSPC